jgi:cytosine/adenosine deaminase-related metal-dependent hydrolase
LNIDKAPFMETIYILDTGSIEEGKPADITIIDP